MKDRIEAWTKAMSALFAQMAQFQTETDSLLKDLVSEIDQTETALADAQRELHQAQADREALSQIRTALATVGALQVAPVMPIEPAKPAKPEAAVKEPEAEPVPVSSPSEARITKAPEAKKNPSVGELRDLIFNTIKEINHPIDVEALAVQLAGRHPELEINPQRVRVILVSHEQRTTNPEVLSVGYNRKFVPGDSTWYYAANMVVLSDPKIVPELTWQDDTFRFMMGKDCTIGAMYNHVLANTEKYVNGTPANRNSFQAWLSKCTGGTPNSPATAPLRRVADGIFTLPVENVADLS